MYRCKGKGSLQASWAVGSWDGRRAYTYWVRRNGRHLSSALLFIKEKEIIDKLYQGIEKLMAIENA
jgi:hypothetical protein